MGKNQKKRKGRAGATKAHAQQPRKAGVNKADAQQSPSVNMAPVPLSLGGTTADDSCCGSCLPKVESTSCKHVQSKVNLDKLKKQFARDAPGECHECTHGTRGHPSKLKGRPKVTGKKALWICLACGQIVCGAHPGEAKQKDGDRILGTAIDQSHVMMHVDIYKHPVVMQWDESLECLCLYCNAQLEYAGVSGADSDVSVDKKSLKTATQPETLQKVAAVLHGRLYPNSSSLKVGDVDTEQVSEVEPKGKPEMECEVDSEVQPVAEPEVNSEVEEVSMPSSKPIMEVVRAASPKVGSRRVIKGLMNLGNTCFFNSVMQNLVGVSLLREHFSTEASGQEGVLKVALRRFFQEMDPNPSEKAEEGGGSFVSKSTIKTRSFGYSVGNGAVSPRGLFSAICAKAPRFKGFQQQDSHELLRCLLDGLHMEEESIRKGQRSAVDKGVGSGADSDTKEEGSPQKLPDTLVEHLFGGQFSSTVSCCECGHSSVTHEPFLDLSLPIPSKQSSGKGEPFSLHLPKLIATRNQSKNASSNGVVSGKAAIDSKSTAIEAPKKPALVPVRGNSLQNSIAGGRAASSESINERDSGSAEEKKGSATGNKDHIGQEVFFTVNPFPCESISNSSGPEKIDTCLDLLEDPRKGAFEEISGSPVVDDLDTMPTGTGSPDVSDSKGVEPHPQEEASSKYGEPHPQGEASSKCGEPHPREEALSKCGEGFDEISTSQEMFTALGGGVFQIDEGRSIPPDNGHPIEEATPVYGPLQFSESDDRAENKNECRALVLVPSNSNGISAGGQTNINLDTASTSISKAEATAGRGSEEDGEEDAGIGGLFDDDESSFSTAPQYKFETPTHESSGFSLMDSIAAVPVFGQVLSGRSGSARGVVEADTYPTMSLEGCLQAFTKAEILSGENAWACENCARIAHAQLEAERVEIDCSPPVAESEGQSSVIGSPSGSDDVDTMQEWDSVCLEDGLEESSSFRNFTSMVVVPKGSDGFAGKLDEEENGTIPELNGNVDSCGTVEGRSGVSLTELNIAGGDSLNDRLNNSLKRSQSLDGCDESKGSRPVAAGERSSQGEKEDAGEPYAMVEGSSKKARNSDIVLKKERKGKASAKNGVEAGTLQAKAAIVAKTVEKDPPKILTVKRDATKRFLISKAPLGLTVHLKRFAQDLHGRLSKLSGHITFHEQLNLGPFIKPQRDGFQPDVVYQLIGIVEHSGTMRGGHYVAYVKGCKMEGKDWSEGAISTWYYISDSHVRETCLESVLQSEAYLLFYERQTFDRQESD